MIDDTCKRIDAPWTDEQVESLNNYQISGVFHEFTCGGKVDGKDCREPLIATRDGWICKKCAYRQNWAHKWMTDNTWKMESDKKWIQSALIKSLLYPDSTEMIGDPKPHLRFDQLMSNPNYQNWTQWQSFYNGWLEGRAQLYQELRIKAVRYGL
jgi:hypothetical protein